MESRTTLALSVLAFGAVHLHGAVPRPNLIPLPQQVEPLAAPLSWPAGPVAIVAEEESPMIGAGLGELDAAIGKLGGTPPVRAKTVDAAAAFALIVGTPAGSPLVAWLLREHQVKLDAQDPGPQGYVIRFLADGAKTRVLLAGSDAPGACMHRGYNHDPIHDGTQPPETAGALLDSVSARFFGERAGPLVAEAVRGDVSWLFTKDPANSAAAARGRLAGRQTDIPGWEEATIGGLDDLAGLMRRQADGSQRGLAALLRVEQMLAAKEIVFDNWPQWHLRFVLSYFGAVRAVSAVRAPVLAAAGLAAIPESLRLIGRTSETLGGPDRWLWESDAGLRKRVEAQGPELERLQALAQGIAVEPADTPANLKTATYLLRRGEVEAALSEKCALELSAAHARTPSHPALVFLNRAQTEGAIARWPVPRGTRLRENR